MTVDERFRAMAPEEREALCREVLESLSDLVEGEASPELTQRVEEILGRCQPYLALRDTLSATIDLARECGKLSLVHDDRFRRCVEQIKHRLP